MKMIKAKHPHCNITHYDGEFNITFECVGEKKCTMALYEIMPPDTDDHCVWRADDGFGCRCCAGRVAALRVVMDNINSQLKMIG